MYKKLIVCLIAVSFAGCDTKVETVETIVQVPQPDPTGQPLTIDVQASSVDGAFTLGGSAFPGAFNEVGLLAFYDPAAQSLVEVGKSNDGSYDAMLVNGTYDTTYRFSAGSQVPANHYAVVQAGVAVASTTTVNIDVPVVSVRPQFLLNGGSFPASQYDRARFFLVPAAGGEPIFLGESHIVNDNVRVVPGTYHVIYSQVQGVTVPVNQNARVMSDVDISSDMLLAVDVNAVEVRTSFLHNGSPFPASQYERAEFYLVNDTGDEAFVGQSYFAPATVRVVGGVYDLEYRHKQGSTLPLNKATRVRSAIDLTAGGDASVDVPSFTLDINATLNGQPFPVSEYDDGELELFDPVSGSYSLLGNTHSPFAGLLVIPGSYDILYTHETGNDVPQNVRGRVLAGYVVAGNQQLDLDITGHTMTLALTLDNGDFPLSGYDYADILLKGDATAEEIDVSSTIAQDEPFMVLPGTYDVTYSCKVCSTVPFNTYATIINDLEINADGVISADIASVRVKTTATLNGAPFPQSYYQSGVIYGSLQEGDAVELTSTATTTDDVILIPGAYSFYYQHENGEQVPANLWSLVDQQTISP